MGHYVPPGWYGPSGYKRAPRVTAFDDAFWHFVRGHDWHPFASRGYRSKGGEFRVDHHLIARRKHGKVQMYLTYPEIFPHAIANAIRRVQRECDEHNLHLHICGEHEDCRSNEELGIACWNDRHSSQRQSNERGGER